MRKRWWDMFTALLAGVWVIACIVSDLKSRRIPNRLMVLGWISAALLRASSIPSGKESQGMRVIFTLAAWTLALTFWLTRWWGAADAKFVMALTLAYPNLWMLLIMAVMNLGAGLLVIRCLSHSKRGLPAVACLGAGWLAWEMVFIATGRPL